VGRSSSRSWTSRLPKTFERFTERARQVVVLAQDEARALRHNYIGTEHLLLGVLREQEGLGARTLANLGVTTEEARSRIAQIIGEGEEVTTGQIPFTPRAKKVLELSLRECHTLGHNYIGTEHILLGIVRENEGVASRVLLDLGTDAKKVRDAVIGLLGGRTVYPRETPVPTPTTRRRHWSPLSLVAVTWALGALTLGAGIAIGWAIWG